MIRKEFDVEQIDLISKFLFNILFPEGVDKIKVDEFKFDDSLIDLKLKLKGLIDSRKFVEAQDLLMFEIESKENDRDFLKLAVWFYLKVDEFEDDVLEKHEFSRHDVLEGLEKIERLVLKT